MPDRFAEIGYSKEYGRFEVTVPHGTKAGDLAKVLDTLLAKEIVGRFPRGCSACTSGDHLLIRERLENVIRVDLDKRKVVARS